MKPAYNTNTNTGDNLSSNATKSDDTQCNCSMGGKVPAEVAQGVLVLGLKIFLHVYLVDFDQVQQSHF